MQQTTTNIGLFGGTFDPIHTGHLIIAEMVRTRCDLQQICFIPAKKHALKDNAGISPSRHRLRMVELAIAGNPHFTVSDIELKRKGVSYTIDTIRSLRKTYAPPDYQLHFLVGSDVVNEFHRWKSPDVLLRLCHFIAFGREGMSLAGDTAYAKAFELVSVPGIEISASDIRERVQRGDSIRYMVPGSVRDYILQHHLYRL